MLELDPSGNAFYDQWFSYDSNGVINWNSSPQIPGLACVVSANHIQVAQAPTTTTVAPAPTTTTTTPVTPVTVSGTIPNVK
jgi:hypothetical protein